MVHQTKKRKKNFVVIFTLGMYVCVQTCAPEHGVCVTSADNDDTRKSIFSANFYPHRGVWRLEDSLLLLLLSFPLSHPLTNY